MSEIGETITERLRHFNAVLESGEPLEKHFHVTTIKGEWQPIKTAPVNQSILIFLPNWDHYGHGVHRAMLVDKGTGKRWMTTAWACGRDLNSDMQPTHWMSLPEPPA